MAKCPKNATLWVNHFLVLTLDEATSCRGEATGALLGNLESTSCNPTPRQRLINLNPDTRAIIAGPRGCARLPAPGCYLPRPWPRRRWASRGLPWGCRSAPAGPPSPGEAPWRRGCRSAGRGCPADTGSRSAAPCCSDSETKFPPAGRNKTRRDLGRGRGVGKGEGEKRGKTAHTRDRRSGQWQSAAPQPHKLPPTLPEGPEPGSGSPPYTGRPQGSSRSCDTAQSLSRSQLSATATRPAPGGAQKWPIHWDRVGISRSRRRQPRRVGVRVAEEVNFIKRQVTHSRREWGMCPSPWEPELTTRGMDCEWRGRSQRPGIRTPGIPAFTSTEQVLRHKHTLHKTNPNCTLSVQKRFEVFTRILSVITFAAMAGATIVIILERPPVLPILRDF